MPSDNSQFGMVYLLGSSQVQIKNRETQELKYVHSAGQSNGPTLDVRKDTPVPKPEG